MNLKYTLKTSIAIVLTLFAFASSTLAQEDGSYDDLLSMDFEQLMDVKITLASKKAESSFDSPLSSTVISAEEIQNSGATSIPEIFRLVPGMIVREETNGNYDVHIRGNDNIPTGSMTFSSENTFSLIMIDNRKVYNYANGGIFWETLPISIDDIERVEIIRGAATAMYGPNAVSGVINIITKKSEQKALTVNANAQTGTANTGLYTVAVGGSQLDNKLNFRASANYEKRDRFENEYYSWITGSKVNKNNVIDLVSFRQNSAMAAALAAQGSPTPTQEEILANSVSTIYSRDDLDSNLSKEQKGLNLFTDYAINKTTNIYFDAGYQESNAQTVFMETTSTPISERSSESGYLKLKGEVGDLSAMFGYNSGTQDILVGASTVSKYDFDILEGGLEYNYSIGELSLRPGINFQQANYSDAPYTTDVKKGYLNRDQDLFNLGVFVRSEYNVTEKLRAIAALRVDHYNNPGDKYFTYQFITTYSINDKNLIRANYSRANRGPFITDVYANYQETNPLTGQTQIYAGNKDINLPTTDLIELGYRSKLLKNLLLEGEIFYSETEDYTNLVLAEDFTAPVVTNMFSNVDIKATQKGASASINWMPSKQYTVKLFGTYQTTDIENGSTTSEHKHTPNFYGGAIVNATPIEKLNINTSLYYIGEQTYIHYTGSTATVDANTIVNAKISYQLAKFAKVYVNGRNLLNTDKEQFGFADMSQRMILGGVELKF